MEVAARGGGVGVARVDFEFLLVSGSAFDLGVHAFRNKKLCHFNRNGVQIFVLTKR